MDFNPLYFTDPTNCISDAMQLARTIRRYPNAEIAEKGVQVLVSQTKRMLDIGLPVNVDRLTLRSLNDATEFYYVDGRVAWLITEDGDYILGTLGVPAVHQSIQYHTYYIYEIEQGVWGMGEAMRGGAFRNVFRVTDDGYLGRVSGDSQITAPMIMEMRRSDGLPARGLIEAPSHVYRLAPWGLGLFPVAGMSQDHRDALLVTAKMEYERRVGMYAVQLQAHRRGWGDEYRKNVRDRDVHFPEPTFVSGLQVRVVSEPMAITDAMSRAQELLRESGVEVNLTSEDVLTLETDLSGERNARTQQEIILREANRRLPDKIIRAVHIISQSEFMASMGAHR